MFLEHGTTITGTSGDITSPGYPTKYAHANNYEWTVIVPDNMFVSVQFVEIGIPTLGYNTINCLGFIKVGRFNYRSVNIMEYIKMIILLIFGAVSIQYQIRKHISYSACIKCYYSKDWYISSSLI